MTSLIEEFRRHRWNRPALALAALPIAFGALIFGVTSGLELFQAHSIAVPAWLLLLTPLLACQLIFLSLALFGFGSRFPGGFSRYVALNLICLPITAFWFACFYAFAWFTQR